MSLRAKGLTAFLLMAFVPPWAIWELHMADGWIPGQADIPPLVLMAAFCPAAASAVTRRWVTKEGFAEAGMAFFPRRAWPWYLAAWLFPLGAGLAALCAARMLGWGTPDWTLAKVALALPPEFRTPAWAVTALMVSALPASFVLFGEEFGWRGWLQGRLSPSRPILDAVLTGLVWSLWHAPLILRGFDYPGRPLAGMAAFTGTAVFVSVILGWIKQGGKSIWPVCLGHASINAVGLGLTGAAFAPGADLVLVSFVGLAGWIPLGGLALFLAATGRLRPWRGSEAEDEKTTPRQARPRPDRA